MRLEGFSKIVLDASIRIFTRADLMKHRKRTGQGGQNSASRHVYEAYTQLRVYKTLFMRLEPRR